MRIHIERSAVIFVDNLGGVCIGGWTSTGQQEERMYALYASSMVCTLLAKFPFCRLVEPSICSKALIGR